jgi:hypothetical protein
MFLLEYYHVYHPTGGVENCTLASLIASITGLFNSGVLKPWPADVPCASRVRLFTVYD